MANNFILVNPPYNSPNHIHCKDRLIHLKLLPTKYQREILDIIFFVKCLHHKATFNIEDYITFETREAGARTRNQDNNT